MNRKLSALAIAAFLAGSGLAGCGSSMDVQGYGSSAQVNAAMVMAAKEWDPQAKTDTESERSATTSRFLAFLNELRDVPQLAPLWDLYAVPNPITMDDDDHSAGLIQLLKAVRFTVRNGTLTIANRATGGVIFTAPTSNLASGTFNAANLPGGTTTPPPTGGGTCSSFTYSTWGACSASGTQTRTVLSSSPAGCTGGSPVLTQACTPPPTGGGTCTSFTYSAWSACSATGTQTRTVLTSSPSGCTGGAPVTSQACTPAIDGAALYTATCSGCHGPLATSTLKGKRISLALINQFNMRWGLTDAQLQAIVTAVGP
jgi:hypothetical protein